MTELGLTLACAVLAAVSAFLATVCWRKCADVLTEVTGIASALRSVRSKVETHDAELDSVTDALQRLRGKFYAERRKSPPESSSADGREATGGSGVPEPKDPASTLAWKAAMRAKLGLVPSRK